MMRILPLLLITFLAACSPGKKKDVPGKTEIPAAIAPKKTATHVNIPGTHLYLSPLPGYRKSENMIGLQKNNAVGINVNELIGGNYYSNTANFTRANFEATGATVTEFKELSVNGYPARYICLNAQGNGSINLVFGDTTFSVMLAGLYPAADSISEEEIKQTLLTVVYDKNLKVDPFASAFFMLDERASDFKFLKNGGPAYIYSLNGSAERTPDNPSFIATGLPADGTMSPILLANKMLEGLSRYGMMVVNTKKPDLRNVNGYQCCEMEVSVLRNDTPSWLYQMVVINGNRALVMQGMADSNYEKYLPQFKALAHTVRFK